MPTRQAKPPVQAASPGQRPPSQPAWRQPPPKKRVDLRPNQTVVPSLGKEATRPMGALALRRVAFHVNRRGIAMLAAVAAVVFCLGQAWFNEGFRVSATEIRGTARVLADDVSQISDVTGQSVFRIRPASVAKRISALPGVAGATVHVRLPNQVVIDVREEEPWVAWQVITQTLWLTADGHTQVPMAGDPPTLTLMDQAGGAMDDAGQMKSYVFANLVAFHIARPDVANVYYGPEEGLFYRALEGWTVYLGDDGKLTPKLALLQAIQGNEAVRKVRPDIIDLRYEGRAEIR